MQQAGLLEGQLDALSYLGGAFLTELRRGLGGPEEAGEGGDGEEDTGREEQAGNGLGARLWQRPRGRREASERVLYGLQDAIRRLASVRCGACAGGSVDLRGPFLVTWVFRCSSGVNHEACTPRVWLSSSARGRGCLACTPQC